MTCAYCDRPLTCEACGVDYRPPDAEHYHALSQADTPITCPECESLLVCHWCKTPYDGVPPGEQPDEA